MFHIYPVNDIKEHILVSSTCNCNPSIIFKDGEIIIVHNSFDGREFVEKLLTINPN